MKNYLGPSLISIFIFFSQSIFASDTHIVKMLNNSQSGIMVFEPAYIKIKNGDSINFIMEDAGHNASTVAGPSGSIPFNTAYKPSTIIKFDVNGLYLYECSPHSMMAMAGIIQVSDSNNKKQIIEEVAKFEAKVMMPNVKTRISDLLKENIK